MAFVAIRRFGTSVLQGSFGRLRYAGSCCDESSRCKIASCQRPLSFLPSSQQASGQFLVLPMPKLSHNMYDGTVAKWMVKDGTAVPQYGLLFEVETDNLVEDAYKLDDFAGTVSMLIESQEDGFIAKILIPEGRKVKVGTPIALWCEYAEDMQKAKDFTCPTDNVYDDSQPEVKVLEWQSYLKTSSKEGSGCM